MMMRMLQITCVLVLGLLASASRVDARWEGPCFGEHCTTCDAPDPSGDSCWVGPGGGEEETCQYYGCKALRACGEDLLYAQCECEPCNM
jgi:hypothetical protein